MAQVAEGSQSAVWELLDRYSSNILRVVRRHLPASVRSKVDSQDVVQSVWKSLLRNPPHLASAEAFVTYIATMARNKVFETHRHFTKGQAYDVRREVSISSESAGDNNTARRAARDLADARMSTPSAIVRARETWDLAIDAQGEVGRRVVELRLQGLKLDEIADRLGISYAMVRRSLQFMFESMTK